MSNDMGLTPSDLTGLPGSPFTQGEVDRAVASVRGAARWRIALQAQETVTVDVERCQRILRLPTAFLVSVDEVKDTDTSTVIAASTYRVSLTECAVETKCGYWPQGWGRVTVKMTHGYSSVPDDLIPVFAEAANMERRDQLIKSQNAGPFSVAFGTDAQLMANPTSTASVLDRYSFLDTGLA